MKFINLQHEYNNSETAISFPDFSLDEKEQLLITGGSGRGKTTLLHIIGGLLKPTRGEVYINGTSIYDKSNAGLDQFRSNHIGIVFQRIHLISALTVSENLALAQYLAKRPKDSSLINTLLAELGISEKTKKYPNELSFGESQRVGLARAVINKPTLLLADEPTSNLDDENSRKVLTLLQEQASKNGAALIIATHDERIKRHYENILDLNNKTVPKGTTL
ncbi:MAG: ABC transporter ATP-binding protein [Balneolaceae bacterium]|nr:ABC transporter ATP-binding protein [Balneolaceae bacterium]